MDGLSDTFMSDIIGERPLYDWWEQRQLISRMERSDECEDMSRGGQEIIWAAIVHYQAFHVADWMVSRSYVATEVHMWGEDGEDRFSCVPYDVLKWDEWVQSKLMIPPPDVPDKRRKEIIKEMVKREYIKIPLNSGIPLYHWITEGYRWEDFCEVYSCVERFGSYYRQHRGHSGKCQYFFIWAPEQIETCLECHLDESIRAGSALHMVLAAWEMSSVDAELYGNKLLAKLVENMYRKYRDRKQSVSATKIQCAFRVYHSSKRVNVLRSHPDNLFSNFSALRKRKLSIDDTRFGAVV